MTSSKLLLPPYFTKSSCKNSEPLGDVALSAAPSVSFYQIQPIVGLGFSLHRLC